MKTDRFDVIVVGGGPAGLAAALSAWEHGAQRVAILERNQELGGILNQCIHNGFGLHYFQEELTGPEYADRFLQMVRSSPIEVFLDTMVLEISQDKTIRAVNKRDGVLLLSANAIILTMGCRERTRGAIAIPGDRPAGVFTAGTAQLFLNVEGYLVGKRAVILGSGDIGLIMARRLTLEGAKVLCVAELEPYSNGLNRNLVQCLEDFQIPLLLSHTITEIRGGKRVEQVVIQRVDAEKRPVPGSEQVMDCDTVLLSVGLIPENELSRQAGLAIDARTNGPVVFENMETSVPGIFACGNVVHVHDLVDFVTMESRRAGAAAAKFSGEMSQEMNCVEIEAGNDVSYTVPQRLRLAQLEKSVEIFFRVRRVFQKSKIVVRTGQEILAQYRRERMAPGEMERIVLPKALLDKRTANILTLSAEEEETK